MLLDNIAMEPRIRYATTADGVRIAFWTLGDGAPLVYLAGGPWSHIELWQVPECRRWYERLARHRRLIRYDVRGTGLSERDVSDYSLDALVLDVEAVVDRLGLDRFWLFGAADAGPVAAAYAARHPERVSRLVLWCAWARTADIQSPRIQAWLGLIDRDWELMTDTCAHIVFGWSGGEIGRRAAQRLRDSVTREAAQAALDALGRFDVTALLPSVKSPTLVLHRREIPWLPVGVARGLASRPADARLTILEGESTAPYLGDTESVARAIGEFLGEGDTAPAEAEARRVNARSTVPSGDAGGPYRWPRSREIEGRVRIRTT
jgi:pimeloyl-ACP methyl ester carboxylesterase